MDGAGALKFKTRPFVIATKFFTARGVRDFMRIGDGMGQMGHDDARFYPSVSFVP